MRLISRRFLKLQAIGNLLLAGTTLIPGHLVAIAAIDFLGRKRLQVFGFLILALLFCILGFDYSHLTGGSIIALVGLCNFIGNAGPNTTTFVVPAEVFPTRYRATAYGVSSAAGKIGSIISQVVFFKQGNVNNSFKIYSLLL
jgi:PHS family inorganic phosphate transporter-like MFS transporter